MDINSIPAGPLQPGQILKSRYRILGIIGISSRHAVYQARDMHFTSVTKLCAVVELIDMAQDQQVREWIFRNFERESEILATLSHPAIPQFYAFFSYGDRAYLVEEFIQGRDLEAILKADNLLPVEQIRQWGIQICEVLTYLHEHKPQPIIYRNMQPSHVMIDERMAVHLIDFELATLYEAGKQRSAVIREGYSAPEEYEGFPSPASDIYSLGATLHRLLPINANNSKVPDTLAEVVMRAMQQDPSQRYATAEEMKNALKVAGS